MLESDTESIIESKNKHPHLHLTTKNINVHISESENVDDMKRFIQKSNREGPGNSPSDELKKLDEKIHALEWLVNFSATEEDKEIHKKTILFFKKQRERIKRDNAQI